MPIVTLRIEGVTPKRRRFVCGVVVTDGIVTEAAPLLYFTRHWPIERLVEWVVARHWSLDVVREEPSPADLARALDPTGNTTFTPTTLTPRHTPEEDHEDGNEEDTVH